MKKTLAFILAVIIVSALVPTYLMVPTYAGEQEDAMWIEPETIEFETATTSVGDRFNVTLWLWVTSDNMFSWQFKLFFDPTQLKATRAGYSNGSYSEWAMYRTGGGTGAVTPSIEEDYVLFTESCTGDNYVPAGVKARLAWVEFEIVAAPPFGGSLESMLDIDNPSTWVMNPDMSYIPIVKEGASYSYVWSAPPSPRLAVDPSYVEFDPYTDAVGKEFDENIVIEGLSAAWFLKNASTHLAYDSSLIEVVSVTFGPAWDVATDYSVTDGDIYLYGEASTPPSGDVILATVRFRVIFQDTAPPRTAGDYDASPLDLYDYHLYAETLEITTAPEVDGEVRIYCRVALPIPYLEVSSITLGAEELARGEFNITVSLKNLDCHWYVVGIQFRLTYPADLIEPVALYEGPFFQEFAAMQPGSMGTFMTYYFEDTAEYGPSVVYGEIIYPNATGWWHEPFPEGEGVIAIITFVPKIMLTQENITGSLDIVWQGAIGLDSLETQNPVYVTLDTPINGTYTLLPAFVGRMIDLYGGAINAGYGAEIFPEPYGGQGPNAPMDLVLPQSEVHLYAKVTYNFWPVQNKTVCFEVLKPDGSTYLKLTAATDSDGIASVVFRMPWPCNDPESLFGEWTVVATCSLADEVIMDTMTFHYDYAIHIWKVVTDRFNYNHGDTVTITIEYGSYAMQEYPVLITAIIQDELGVSVGIATANFNISGAQYCTYKNGSLTLEIVNIPKWAFAGKAIIHVNAFDKEPAEGGIGWCPEATAEICIQPH